METLKSLPNNPAAYTPSEDEAPSFNELRAGGCMVIDDSLQKLAVYPGGGGCVVLKEQHFDGPVHHSIIDQKKVPALIAAITAAAAAAAAIDDEIMAQEMADWAEYERRMQSAKIIVLKPRGGAAGA